MCSVFDIRYAFISGGKQRGGRGPARPEDRRRICGIGIYTCLSAFYIWASVVCLPPVFISSQMSVPAATYYQFFPHQQPAHQTQYIPLDDLAYSQHLYSHPSQHTDAGFNLTLAANESSTSYSGSGHDSNRSGSSASASASTSVAGPAAVPAPVPMTVTVTPDSDAPIPVPAHVGLAHHHQHHQSYQSNAGLKRDHDAYLSNQNLNANYAKGWPTTILPHHHRAHNVSPGPAGFASECSTVVSSPATEVGIGAGEL